MDGLNNWLNLTHHRLVSIMIPAPIYKWVTEKYIRERLFYTFEKNCSENNFSRIFSNLLSWRYSFVLSAKSIFEWEIHFRNKKWGSYSRTTTLCTFFCLLFWRTTLNTLHNALEIISFIARILTAMNIGGELVEILTSEQHHRKRKFFYSLLFSAWFFRWKMILRIILEFVEDSHYGNRNRCSDLQKEWSSFPDKREINIKI